MPDESKQLYTPSEIADMLRVVDKTVYRWLESGELNAYKLGRQWRISPEQLQQFLNDRENMKIHKVV
jgi:excisionase family DNA binding protein